MIKHGVNIVNLKLNPSALNVKNWSLLEGPLPQRKDNRMDNPSLF